MTLSQVRAFVPAVARVATIERLGRLMDARAAGASKKEFERYWEGVSRER